MMVAASIVEVKVRLANPETVEDFKKVIAAAESLLDLTWRDEPRQIIEGLQAIADKVEFE